ncbi:hypothetical protein P3342_000484 [Pyrenophora teres f. teres]|nr:hypothetical protein P3342_000484 [Pyrenophora teres f. teres]
MSSVKGLLLASLAGSTLGSAVSRAAPVPFADTVFVNGVIHTLDDKSTTITGGSLSVTNGAITCVGREQDCKPTIGNSTKVVDLNGKAMIPGLIDAHIHPLDAGRAMLGCTMRFQQLTQAALRQNIQACLDSQPGQTGLLTVTEFDREGFTAINGPAHRSMLDSLRTTRPIAIIASNQHNIFVNSKALEAINITRSTPNPPGGRLGRDANGDLTGLLEENAVVPIRALMGDRGIAQLDAATVALSQLRQKGITSFLDALQTPHTAWSSLKASNELTARVFNNFGIFGSTDFSTIISQAVASKKQLDEGDLVASPGQQWRNVKFFVDGVLPSVSESSWLLEPYLAKDAQGKWVKGNNFGLPNTNHTQLQDLLTRTLDAGMGLHVHASGDQAVRTILNVATAMNRTFAPPTLVLGTDRMNLVEGCGHLNNAGALIAYGSDWPVDPLDPFLALAIGVTRSGDPLNKNSHASFGSQFVGRLDQQPALSREASLRGMTTAAATYLNASSSIGSLEEGKFADLLILDNDYFDEKAVPDEKLARNKVLMTMVGGRAVFADKTATFLPSEWHSESQKLESNPVVQRMKPGNILSRAVTGRACGSHAGHSH